MLHVLILMVLFLIPALARGEGVFEMGPREGEQATMEEQEKPPTPPARAVAILEDEELSPAARVEQLRALANQHADDGAVWTAYGEALEQAGQSARALEVFERATRIDPSSHTPWLWVGILLKRGTPEPDLRRAEQAFRRALTEGAPRPRALNELGVTMALQGKMEEAIRAWRQALEEDPGWGVLHSNVIRAARDLGKSDIMREHAEKALKAERFEPTGVFIYGEHLAGRGRASEAAAFYEKAMEAHPEELRFRFYRAKALAAAGTKEEALSELRAVHEMAAKEDPLSEEAQFAHWEIFKLENPRDEAAFQEARNVIFTFQDPSRARTRDLNRAVTAMNSLVEKHPGLWNARFVRARGLRLLGEVEAAEADLQEALETLPGEPNSTMELALIRRDQYRFNEAADLAEEAVGRAPRDPLFAINGGLIMVEAGRCDRAWELYRAVIRMVGEEAGVLLRDQIELKCREGSK